MLEDAIDALSTPKPIDAWADAIGAAADSLAATSEREAWQRSELQRVLDDVVDEATVAAEPDDASHSERFARCSPSVCRAVPRGRTSAPAT